jgi:hypothetical protein
MIHVHDLIQDSRNTSASFCLQKHFRKGPRVNNDQFFIKHNESIFIVIVSIIININIVIETSFDCTHAVATHAGVHCSVLYIWQYV